MKRVFLGVLVILFMSSVSYGADQFDKTKPADNTLISAFPALQRTNNEAIDRILVDYREGAQLVYSSASGIDISAGSLACSNSDGSVRRLRTITSSLSLTWSDIDTGSEESSTTYYVYAVADTDVTTFTGTISKSSSAPSGKTYYKRLGSFYNDASSNITVVKNDDERVIVSSGTVADGGTISVPSGWSQDECSWTVALGDGSSPDGESHPDGVYYVNTVNSSRVATCEYGPIGGEATSGSTTCNYTISCYR